jgi:hypothetical protein
MFSTPKMASHSALARETWRISLRASLAACRLMRSTSGLMRFFPVVLLALPLAVFAQHKMQTPSGEAPGPWLLGTIGVGKVEDGKQPATTALKGLAVRLGAAGEAAICYDLDLGRSAGGWTGGKFTTPMNLMSRGEFPTALGQSVWNTGGVAGFVLRAPDSSIRGKNLGVPQFPAWADPRSEPFGPLPAEQVRFRGFRTGVEGVVLEWQIGGVTVFERPGFEMHDGVGFITRSFAIERLPEALFIAISAISEEAFAQPDAPLPELRLDEHGERGIYRAVSFHAGGKRQFFEAWNVPVQSTLLSSSGHLWLAIAPSAKPLRFKIVHALDADEEKIIAAAAKIGLPRDTPLTSKPHVLWPEIVETKGEPAPASDAAYVVDSIVLPEPNPWNAPMFVGGHDFFADGRAALCTFHGDVFIVSGLDDRLDKITWRRFASGLYHALGLKIVGGEIYVTCRDGLWRLRDTNEDGECDHYEAFNFDLKVTKNFHEFVFDLHTDPDGHFLFAKGGPVRNGGHGFEQIVAHHGTLLRVTPDGKRLDVIATGFRAPNGIGVGPRGELTSGDNEGTWTPACRLNWIKPGGFYGVVDLAHRDPAPTDYDRPLCWFPKRVDNSSGSQAWVPNDDRWGPWRGQLLHLSYGRGILYGVLREEVRGTMQGGVVAFPFKFQSGAMRARFHPIDGQLWITGLRGWQTDGLKNGCLQRVRYTGSPLQMPAALHARENGIEIRFHSTLETQSAADPENWHVEAWNYLWSSGYGSGEFSTEPVPGSGQPRKGRDTFTVKSASIGTDDRTVFLEIPNLRPVMQMSIRYQLNNLDGSPLKGEIINSIHQLGEPSPR